MARNVDLVCGACMHYTKITDTCGDCATPAPPWFAKVCAVDAGACSGFVPNVNEDGGEDR